MDEDTLLKLKREAAIRSKEEDFERRKKAEEKKKRQQLQELREEYENRLVKREADRLALLKKQTELRARKKAENDRLNNLRETNIARKQQAWKARADQEIQAVIEEQVAEEERLEEAITEARVKKREKATEKQDQARDVQSRKEELDMLRKEKK